MTQHIDATRMSTLEIRTRLRQAALVLGVMLCLLATPTFAAETPSELAAGEDPWKAAEGEIAEEEGQRVVGRVVGLRGIVYAQTPGESRRRLIENAPIYPGDRLTTAKGAQLGVLSGDYYTGLDGETTLTYTKRGHGAPHVSLERGDVRVINSGDGAQARIETPGLLAANGSSDTRAYAVEEKAWVVSVVCALEGQVQVAGPGGESMVVGQGGCAASKGAEGVFAAGDAGGDDVLGDDDFSGPPIMGSVAPLFIPDVSGPSGDPLALALGAGIPNVASGDPGFEPCSSPGSSCGDGSFGLAPTNPWVGGFIPPPPAP